MEGDPDHVLFTVGQPAGPASVASGATSFIGRDHGWAS
jgi:hypothetical protein